MIGPIQKATAFSSPHTTALTNMAFGFARIAHTTLGKKQKHYFHPHHKNIDALYRRPKNPKFSGSKEAIARDSQ